MGLPARLRRTLIVLVSVTKDTRQRETKTEGKELRIEWVKKGIKQGQNAD